VNTNLSKLDRLLEEKQALLGCAIDSASPAAAEMVGMLGYDIVWADLEHCGVGLERAEEFCRAAKAGGAMPLLRIPDASRFHVLHALEAGARLIVVPMIEDPDTAREIVVHGKYPPFGKRGFNGSSRGLRYGIGEKRHLLAEADRETYLFVQIETVEGVRRCSEIMSVEGIAGGLVGPADLSLSLGRPFEFDNPAFLSAFVESIRGIRSAGKIAATASGSRDLLQIAFNHGLQIAICASEIAALRNHFEKTLSAMRNLVLQNYQADSATLDFTAFDKAPG